jgi:hypothetical protein
VRVQDVFRRDCLWLFAPQRVLNLDLSLFLNPRLMILGVFLILGFTQYLVHDHLRLSLLLHINVLFHFLLSFFIKLFDLAHLLRVKDVLVTNFLQKPR